MMSSSIAFERPLQYSDLFEGDLPDPVDLLQGIKRDQILNAAVFFVVLQHRKEDFINFVRNFFSSPNENFRDSVLQGIEKIELLEGQVLVLTNQVTSLDLFELAFENVDESSTMTNAEAEIALFKAYILINQRNNELVDSIAEQVPEGDNKIYHLLFAMSFPHFDLENFTKRNVFCAQLIRTIYLFEFLQENRECEGLFAEFLTYYQVDNWKDYLRRILGSVMMSLKSEEGHYTDIVIERTNDEEYRFACDFLDKHSLQETSELIEHDYVSLRATPFYKVNSETYRVIFDVFSYEMLGNGTYFKLLELSQKEGSSITPENFKRIISTNFSEEYLLSSILNTLFSKVRTKWTGEELRDLGILAEPDYYVRDGKRAFLFESKDILIGAAVKKSFDYELLEKEIKKKLYFDVGRDDKIKKKAILQLLNNIKNIVNVSFAFDQNYRAKTLEIYPIIVLFHRQFSVPGLNKIVNEWFEVELQKSRQEEEGLRNVKPITIINIDTLLVFQDYLLQSKFSLEKVINSFHTRTRITRRPVKNKQHLDQLISSTAFPFDLFLRDEVFRVFGSQKMPKMLAEKGYTMFE